MRNQQLQRQTRRHQRQRARLGAAAVEFAIIFPILITITFGMLELSRAQTIVGTARTSAFAGAREAAVAKTNAGNVRAEIENVLQIFDIDDSTITITPEDFGSASNVTVRLQVPYSASNGMIFNWFIGSSEIDLTTSVAR